MTKDELVLELAKALAIQELEDESLAGCWVWSWVVENKCTEEWMDKSKKTIAFLESHGFRMVVEVKIPVNPYPKIAVRGRDGNSDNSQHLGFDACIHKLQSANNGLFTEVR